MKKVLMQISLSEEEASMLKQLSDMERRTRKKQAEQIVVSELNYLRDKGLFRKGVKFEGVSLRRKGEK